MTRLPRPALPADATFFTVGRTLPRRTFLDTRELGELSKVNVKLYRVVGSLLDSLGFDLLGYQQCDDSGQDILTATEEEHAWFTSERRVEAHDF